MHESRHALARDISAIAGEKVTAHNLTNGTAFLFENGGQFFLFYSSKASAEHIAGCMRCGG